MSRRGGGYKEYESKVQRVDGIGDDRRVVEMMKREERGKGP